MRLVAGDVTSSVGSEDDEDGLGCAGGDIEGVVVKEGW